MTEPKFTPAPWVHAISSDYEFNIVANENFIACVFVDDDISNAKLISAAPDLYKELAWIEDEIRHIAAEYDAEEDLKEWLKRAQQALAKARGEQ